MAKTHTKKKLNRLCSHGDLEVDVHKFLVQPSLNDSERQDQNMQNLTTEKQTHVAVCATSKLTTSQTEKTNNALMSPRLFQSSIQDVVVVVLIASTLQ
mgnify:CR=1 FL=1